MIKKCCIVLLVYHISLSGFNISSLWQKKEQEYISKEYPVPSETTLTLINTEGSITIKHAADAKVTLEAYKKGTAQELKDTKISSDTKPAQIRINTSVKPEQQSARVDYTLLVPKNVHLHITQTKGPIQIKGVNGSMTLSSQDGSITIIDGTKTVSARTESGDIVLEQKKFDEPSSIFLETHRGRITLKIPKTMKANVRAHTTVGIITSDIPITLAPRTITLNRSAWDLMKKDIDGTLGEGGPPITLEATKGSISIKEY